MKMNARFQILLAAGLVPLWLSGCASQGLTVEEADQLGRPAPSHVFVAQFAFAANDPSPDQSILERMNGQLRNAQPQTPEEQAGLSVASVMQKTLIRRLTNEGIPATGTLADLVPPVGSLVIEGELLTVKDANSFQRLSVGLAAGQSQVVSYVNAYIITVNGPVSMMKFYSNDKSSVKPGVSTLLITSNAAVAPTTSAMVGGSVDTLTARRQTAETDAAQTARQIAKKIDQLFENEGWIVAD